MPLDLYVAALSGASLGLASAAHCSVMCGPLAMATRLRGGPSASASYLSGRIVSYVSVGALAGGVGRALLLAPWVRWVEAALAWTLAGTLLWAGWSIWSPRPRGSLIALGRGPRPSGFGGLLSRVAHDPLLLGAATALLPCAALFAAVTAAATTGGPLAGALSMLSFAVVTGVAVFAVGRLAPSAGHSALLRRSLAVVLVAGAVVTGLRPLPLLMTDVASGAACPLHGGSQ